MKKQKTKLLTSVGSGCSEAVEHSPRDLWSWGRGFESRRALGFFLLLSFLWLSIVINHRVSLIRSLIETHLYEQCKSWQKKPSWAAWGEAGLISSDWGNREKTFRVEHVCQCRSSSTPLSTVSSINRAPKIMTSHSHWLNLQPSQSFRLIVPRQLALFV